MMRHCVLCFFSSLLPGITKGFMNIFRRISMILWGGQSYLVPTQPNWGSQGAPGTLPEARTKAVVRKAGSQPPGQSRAYLRSQGFCNFRPCFKSQSSSWGRTEDSHVLVWWERQIGEKIKFPSCAGYRGVMAKLYESVKMFGSNASNAGKAQTDHSSSRGKWTCRLATGRRTSAKTFFLAGTSAV